MTRKIFTLVRVGGFLLLTLPWGLQGEGAEPLKRDIPPGVMQFFERLQTIAGRNSWTYRIGNSAGACNVNWGAHRRCLVIEGRRLGDAVAFTALVGWYERTKDVLGTVFFENGESLVIRAGGDRISATAESPLEGVVSGTLLGASIDGRFTATRNGELWIIEVRQNDDVVTRGVLGSPPSTRSVPSK